MKQSKSIIPTLVGGYIYLSTLGTSVAAVSKEDDIRDIAGPIAVPTPPPWERYALAGLLLLLLSAIFWRLWRWHAARKSPPYQIAMKELQTSTLLMEENHGAPFSDDVSNTVRQYIESVFSIRATHATTDEFLAQLAEESSSDSILHPYRDKLQKFLARCDVVKFSGNTISKEEMKSLLESATDFVESTHAALRAAQTKKTNRRRPWRRLRRQGVSQ